MKAGQIPITPRVHDFVGHTLQADGRCRCGASRWPHRIELSHQLCFMGGGRHNFAIDRVCRDCGNNEPG
jgi:hypothetical protein